MSEFYTKTKWQQLRSKVLRRDKYTDQILIRYGKIKAAEMVHHIFPVKDFPQYSYCAWNLISLTNRTHNTLHDRNTDELTSEGIKLLVKTARENNIPVPEEYLKRISTKPKRERVDLYIPPENI